MPTKLVSIQAALREARGDFQAIDYSQKVEIAETTITVVSDVHIPYYDEELAAFSIAESRRRGVEAYVILGDLFDMHLFSSWGVTDKSTNFQREIKMAATFIRIAAGEVGKVYWSSGNHEDRWIRKNDYHVGLRELAGMCGLNDLLESGKLVVSDNPTLLARGNWMLTHPRTYSSTPLLTPGKLADLYEKHVMCAHAHHFGQGVSPTGKHMTVETGGLFEPSLVQYKQWGVTTHRNWVKGFWVLSEGQPIPFLAGG